MFNPWALARAIDKIGGGGGVPGYSAWMSSIQKAKIPASGAAVLDHLNNSRPTVWFSFATLPGVMGTLTCTQPLLAATGMRPLPTNVPPPPAVTVLILTSSPQVPQPGWAEI